MEIHIRSNQSAEKEIAYILTGYVYPDYVIRSTKRFNVLMRVKKKKRDGYITIVENFKTDFFGNNWDRHWDCDYRYIDLISMTPITYTLDYDNKVVFDLVKTFLKGD